MGREVADFNAARRVTAWISELINKNKQIDNFTISAA
jgi:hypothetical protein